MEEPIKIPVPDSEELVKVIQDIKEEYPNLDTLKKFFQGALNLYVDSASIITVKDVVKELINAIEFIQDMNPEEIVNVTDIAAEILPEGVIEVNLGLVLPPDKNVLLTFTVIL